LYWPFIIQFLMVRRKMLNGKRRLIVREKFCIVWRLIKF